MLQEKLGCKDKKIHHHHRGQGMAKMCGMAGNRSEMTCVGTLISLPMERLKPDSATESAMIEALNLEYQHRAFYESIVTHFGHIFPFPAIVKIESKQIEQWKTIFSLYDLNYPEDTFMGKETIPENLFQACQEAIKAEIAKIEMYDRTLEFVNEKDLQAGLQKYRNVAELKIIPALKDYLNYPN